jgi:hypothetical protein
MRVTTDRVDHRLAAEHDCDEGQRLQRWKWQIQHEHAGVSSRSGNHDTVNRKISHRKIADAASSTFTA